MPTAVDTPGTREDPACQAHLAAGADLLLRAGTVVDGTGPLAADAPESG